MRFDLSNSRLNPDKIKKAGYNNYNRHDVKFGSTDTQQDEDKHSILLGN